MPVGRESGFEIFVCKVFESALQKTFRFLRSNMWVPGHFICGLRPPLSAKRIKKEFRRMLSAPLSIGFGLRRNRSPQPCRQWAILPVVGRQLHADESGPQAQGIPNPED